MTVNKNNRRLFSLAILLLLVLAIPGYAQKKNILSVRFQTAVVHKTTNDTVLNVFYKLTIGRPPVNFHGFQCNFIFENTKIQPITMDQGFFAGTACANASYAHGQAVPPDEYRLQVLTGGESLDTTNPVLCQIRYSVKGFTDSAMIIPVIFDALPGTSGIDTVIIENSPGKDQISWYGFGLMFADTTKPPPVKKAIILSSDSTDIMSDSLKTVSLLVSSLDSANVKSGKFEFDIDTAAFSSAVVTKGALLLGAAFDSTQTGIHVTGNFSSPQPISGELLKISFKGKFRKDTVCTEILNPKLTIGNADNLVSSITYFLHGICVFGRDTVVKGAVEESKGESIMTIYPNPASSFIDFNISDGVKRRIQICDAFGRKIFENLIDASIRWDISSVPAGCYYATVTFNSALNNGKPAETRKILIIH